MRSLLKLILRPFVPRFIFDLLKKQSQKKQIKYWKETGSPLPPPNKVKQAIISKYQKKYQSQLLIETGTFLGDMVEAQKYKFKKIISIELGLELFRAAQKKFIKDKNVLIVQGDSGKVLSDILKNVNEPAIFWLDGHYSAGETAKGDKDCPIFEELEAIFDSKAFNHIILIDDARCFNGQGDYPTIENLTAFIQSKNQNYRAEVENDIIRYTIGSN